MTDSQVYMLAAAVWVAALLPTNVSRLWLVPIIGALLWGWRRSSVSAVLIAATVAASILSGAAWAAIGEAEEATVDTVAVLVSDPVPTAGGVRVRAEVDGLRYDLNAWGASAGHLRGRLMGERLTMRVKLRPLVDAPDWLRAQGLAGRGTVLGIDGFDVGQPHTRIANSLRRTLESGSASLSRSEQSLFSGLVYGDDREQSPLVEERFEAAGLTHLLAVSGQNVAFVLTIVGPVLRRIGYRQRFVVVVAVLLLFATITRFEASVVRASVMTGIAAVAALLGVEVEGRRLLGLAVAGLTLIDPLIAHSVAFQLSVAASAGILWWSGRVARALPGPRILAETFAVTACAQLAVAPLLIWRFDGLPVASLPANLLAAPAAGPVMMWGLTAGLVAGRMPAVIATVIHWPTRLGLWWIDAVAATVPSIPLGRLGPVHIVLLFALGAFGLAQIRHSPRVAVTVALTVVLLHPAVVLSSAPVGPEKIDQYSTIWRDDETTIVDLGARSQADQVLSGLRNHNVGKIDVVVVRKASFTSASLVRWIAENHRIGVVLAAEPTLGVGEHTVAEPVELALDSILLVVRTEDDTLTVSASLRAEEEAAAVEHCSNDKDASGVC